MKVPRYWAVWYDRRRRCGEVGNAKRFSRLALTAVYNAQAKIEVALAREAEVRLDDAEKADADLAVKEKTKIDLLYYASTHQDDVIKFLSGDLKAAIGYDSQYRASVAKGEIVPTKHLQSAIEKAAPSWSGALHLAKYEYTVPNWGNPGVACATGSRS